MFHIYVGSYCEDMDVNQFRRELNGWASVVRFGSVLVMGYDMAGTGIGEGKIVVRHSMTEGEISPESVAAVLDDVLALWQKSHRTHRQLKGPAALRCAPCVPGRQRGRRAARPPIPAASSTASSVSPR
jgi:hypothetical protein